jgi:hypothetical protein
MSKMEVFQFTVRDHKSGTTKTAAHMATKSFIENAKGTIIEGSRRAVDSSLVDESGKADGSVQPGHSSGSKSDGL